MSERESFIEEWKKAEECFAELCRKYEISRQCGYKWVERYKSGGTAGLEERSRAPHDMPQAMSDAVAKRIVELRREHPRWGARKLKAYLACREPKVAWPAASSIGELLRREGLSQPRRKRQRTPASGEPLSHAEAPNQVWSADFKGWFLCRDGQRCDPLTVSDAFSRYLMRCRAVQRTDGVQARAVLEAVFREYGMPQAIRTDNGAPFASKAPAGLSRLSMWWLRLGIRHERIDPGHPEQNGRHERLHQTLKQETASPPKANLWQQQKAFVWFEQEYNEQRPHEALAYKTPASVYVGSAQQYPSKLPDLPYPAGAQLRLISHNGYLKWRQERIFLSEVLARERVGLLEVESDFFEVYYGPLLLGWLDGIGRVFAADPGCRKHSRSKRSPEP